MKNTAIVSRHGMIQVHSDRSPLIKPPHFPYAYFVNHLNSFLLVETMTEIIKSLHSNVVYVVRKNFFRQNGEIEGHCMKGKKGKNAAVFIGADNNHFPQYSIS